MKKNCLFLLLSFGVGNIYAQNAGARIVNPAEVFAGRMGTVIEKRFDEVGKVGYLNVQIEYISDLTTSDKMQCVRFDVQLANNTPGPSALLDTAEVSGLLSFLNYITAKVINHPPVDPNTDISFTDKYNFQIGTYWQKTNGWTVYLRTESENPSTETDIFQADVAGFIKILNVAKTDIQKP
jgi:hypothetical protein